LVCPIRKRSLSGVRYDLNLWIGGLLEGATYLPR
jgi:hypothetical protein